MISRKMSFLAWLAAISEALNSSTAFAALKRLAFSFHFEGFNLVVVPLKGRENAQSLDWAFLAVRA